MKTQQFSLKNEIALGNVQSSERDLVINILKKRFSDLEIELQRKNVGIDYLHSQLSLKATYNSFSSSATRNLNDTSNQDFVGDKLKLPTQTQPRYQSIKIQSSGHQNNNPTIARSNGKFWSQEIRC